MQSPVDMLLAWKGAAILAWLGLFFTLERLAPAASPPDGPAGWRRLARNLVLILLTLPLSRLFVVPVSALAAQHALPRRPGRWRGAPALRRHPPPPRQRGAAARPRAGAVPDRHHALDPLGAPPPRPPRHRRQLRHHPQPLGPALPHPLADAAHPRDGDRCRRAGGRIGTTPR